MTTDPLSAAWDNWSKTDEGDRCARADAAWMSLDNRLKVAFNAGAASQVWIDKSAAGAVMAARAILAEVLEHAEPIAVRTDPTVAAIRTAVELLAGREPFNLNQIDRATCSSNLCGMPIYHGINTEGVRGPLDARPACYFPTSLVGGQLQVVRVRGLMVSHWNTCKDPGRFNRGRRKRVPHG